MFSRHTKKLTIDPQDYLKERNPINSTFIRNKIAEKISETGTNNTHTDPKNIHNNRTSEYT